MTIDNFNLANIAFCPQVQAIAQRSAKGAVGESPSLLRVLLKSIGIVEI
jgi:hypothetical protein